MITAKRAPPIVVLLAMLGLVPSAGGCHVYRSDVGKVCDAEQLSQGSLRAGRSQLFNWMERNVASTEGIHLVQDLVMKDTRGVGVRVREEARKVGVPSCALAEHAELQAKDEDFHTDMVNLCTGNASRGDGSVARLDVVQADDAERMREISEWTTTNAKSPDTLAIVAHMATLPPRQRGAVLRTEAGKVGIASCLLASTLDAPPPSVSPVIAPQVNPNYSVVKVEGSVKNQAVIAAALTSQNTSSAINSCYSNALVGNPTLAGDVVVQLAFDATGRVSKVTEGPSAVKGPILQCIATAMMSVALSGPPPDGGKKGAKATVKLLLAPSTSGPGFAASIDLEGPGTKGGHGPRRR